MIDLRNIENTKWEDVKISILGAGRSGLAAYELCVHIGAKPFISDRDANKIQLSTLDLNFEIGEHSEKVLSAHLIILSPGIPDSISIVQKALHLDIPVISEIEFASWFTNAPILAITGSNGKTTTTNILHSIIDASQYSSLMGGNVGIPFSKNVLLELQGTINNPVHVLELSSFQLEHILHFSPQIACILNISPDHLDRYNDIIDYMNAKLNIVKNLNESARLVYNGNDLLLQQSLEGQYRNCTPFSANANQQAHYFYDGKNIIDHDGDTIIEMNKTKLKGLHNVENILAATTMAYEFGISTTIIKHAIENFIPIPHRIEFVAEINNIKYYNDSKATNIASTIAGITSFDSNVILILGGTDKGETDFTDLIPHMKDRIKLIICYGKAGENILSQLNNNGYILHYEMNFNSSFNIAQQNANSGDTVLLSPACASYDQFSSYEDRGNSFKMLVNNIGVNV
jgi:UDP-N-acetylmuramoylalanine--D-glutamate ligase